MMSNKLDSTFCDQPNQLKVVTKITEVVTKKITPFPLHFFEQAKILFTTG